MSVHYREKTSFFIPLLPSSSSLVCHSLGVDIVLIILPAGGNSYCMRDVKRKREEKTPSTVKFHWEIFFFLALALPRS